MLNNPNMTSQIERKNQTKVFKKAIFNYAAK